MEETFVATLRRWVEEHPFGSRLLVGILVVWWTVCFVRWKGRRERRAMYRAWIEAAVAERDRKLHAVLQEKSNAITDWMTATEVRQAVVRGQPTMTAREAVVRAAHRCRHTRDTCNAVTEEYYDEAAHAASALETAAHEGKLFYGVPISVKECLGMKGTYSTGGLACRLRQRDTQDSLIVAILREQAGALPVASGNVTQIMMLPESVNRIWGRSCNPWNLERTPGGSSGGDAALVATGAVPLAVCSDVAGSIRIPASFCGVTGFKPTPLRSSGIGNMKPRLRNRSGTAIAIPAVVGPICRSVEDCATYMRATLVPALWENDRSLPPLPFREEVYGNQTKLRIGYFDTDGWFEPCATSKRAVQETVALLKKAGHSVETFDLPTDGWFNYGLLVAINGAEGNMRSYVEALEGEEPIPEYNLLLRMSNLPSWLRWVALCVLDERRAHLLRQTQSGGVSTYDYQQKTADLIELRQKWAAAMKDLDALIFPAMPVPALPHGSSGELTSTCAYMFLSNMLLWPSGAVPVTTVRPDEAHYDVASLPANQQDKIARIVAKRVCNERSVGMPIGVSVMSTAFQDETCSARHEGSGTTCQVPRATDRAPREAEATFVMPQ